MKFSQCLALKNSTGTETVLRLTFHPSLVHVFGEHLCSFDIPRTCGAVPTDNGSDLSFDASTTPPLPGSSPLHHILDVRGTRGR